MTTETAGFHNTVGFNDDTRAFLSIPARHDVARRIDCGFLAELVAEHRLGLDEAHALARALALAAEPAGFVADELLGHLLVLHGIHPDPVERRVERALDEMAPAVRERGGEVALAGLDDGVAHVLLTVSEPYCSAGSRVWLSTDGSVLRAEVG